ncbi:MAG: DinB family protein [Spirochaetaceae bacterium]|nr:DinB family protein [Spirochaetaceae bacterium]
MNREDKLELITRFENALSALDGLLAGLEDEALRFVPALPEAWSINDHLVHLLDAEAATYFRIRAAVAEPGFAVPVWEEEAWRARLRYDASDGRACLAAARALRSAAGATLRALADADWEGFWIQHPSRGRVLLSELLETYRDHLAFHAPFVKRNREAWLKRAGA